MARYRKRPIVVDAIQWDGKQETLAAIHELAGDDKLEPVDRRVHRDAQYPETLLYVMTKEGGITASLGDFVIRGIAGEVYPCKPDIFIATYDEVISTEAITIPGKKPRTTLLVPNDADMAEARRAAGVIAATFVLTYGIEDPRQHSKPVAIQELASAVEAAILSHLTLRGASDAT